MTKTGRKAQHHLPGEIRRLRDQYVLVAGIPESVAIEQDPDPRKNDHVWITIRAGGFGPLQIALSTMSRQSGAAGFDPRIRIATVTSNWTELPVAGVFAAEGLDYATMMAERSLELVPFEREALEQLLVAKTGRAVFIEAWGEFFVRLHIGIHQVHSRRASSAVARDLIGRDGAIRFYFERPNECETLLFKFHGQL